MMDVVFTDRAPSPNGHYSQAVLHGDMIYLSNQLPLVPGSCSLPQGIELQARQVIENCRAILNEVGSDLGNVVIAHVQVTNIDMWGASGCRLERSFCEPCAGTFRDGGPRNPSWRINSGPDDGSSAVT